MRTLALVPFAFFLASSALGAEPGRAAGEIAETIDRLSVELFLREADGAYAKGDYAAALDGFSWLAERGSAQARFALGVMYEEGRGVARDYRTAVDWYTQAARQGLARAQLRLARMYHFGRHVRQDNFLAYVWSSLAAFQGDEVARRNRDRIGELISAEERKSALSVAERWAAWYNRP